MGHRNTWFLKSRFSLTKSGFWRNRNCVCALAVSFGKSNWQIRNHVENHEGKNRECFIWRRFGYLNQISDGLFLFLEDPLIIEMGHSSCGWEEVRSTLLTWEHNKSTRNGAKHSPPVLGLGCTKEWIRGGVTGIVVERSCFVDSLKSNLIRTARSTAVSNVAKVADSISAVVSFLTSWFCADPNKLYGVISVRIS